MSTPRNTPSTTRRLSELVACRLTTPARASDAMLKFAQENFKDGYEFSKKEFKFMVGNTGELSFTVRDEQGLIKHDPKELIIWKNVQSAAEKMEDTTLAKEAATKITSLSFVLSPNPKEEKQGSQNFSSPKSSPKHSPKPSLRYRLSECFGNKSLLEDPDLSVNLPAGKPFQPN